MNKPIREGFVKEGEPVELVAEPKLVEQQPSPALEAPAEEDKPTYEELEEEVKRLRARLAPPPDEWPLVIKLLHRPIKAPEKDPSGRSTGKEVMINELSFREPRANDMIKAGGNPLRVAFMGVVDGQPNYDYLIDDSRMTKVMANLMGIQDAYLLALDPRDYASAAYRLRRFFISDQGLW